MTLTTVEDDTVNEQDLPDDVQQNLDSEFRDTVFNPRSTNPTKILTHRASASKLTLKRQPSQTQAASNAHRRVET